MDKNTKTLLSVLFIPISMFVLAFASVPLYDLFCKVTGYGGTTQSVEKPSNIVLKEEIKVRFNSDVSKDLKLYFQPVNRYIISKIGETKNVEYKVKNISNKPVNAISTFNVTPQKAGIYFNKLDCFCYEEKKILPGEEILLPVSFFISPELLKDPNTLEIKSITLSYTFFDNDSIKVENIN